MKANKIQLSVYHNALSDFHVQKTEKPTYAERLHFHDYYQIYFVNYGTITHHYLNTSKQMGKGDAFIIPPNQNHRIEIHEKVVFYSISFFTSFLNNNIENDSLTDFLHNLEPDNEKSLIVQPKVSFEPALRQTFENLLDLMLKEFQSNSPEKVYVLRGLLTVLVAKFLHAYNSLPSHMDKPPRNETARNAVLTYIDKLNRNFTQSLSLENAVHETLLNKSLFCRMFLEITGVTFNRYLNNLRIKKAAELILTTTSNIEEISVLSGYSNYVTFYRNFQNITGISPSRYKSIGHTI